MENGRDGDCELSTQALRGIGKAFRYLGFLAEALHFTMF